MCELGKHISGFKRAARPALAADMAGAGGKISAYAGRQSHRAGVPC